MSSGLKYAVFGSGSWATAIVKMLCENSDQVDWYVRKQQTIDYIISEEHNPSYLSSVELNLDQLRLNTDINTVAEAADVLIFAIPSAFIESELQKVTIDISSKIIMSAVKGIIPESGFLVGEHFHQKYGVDLNNIVVLTGPCHAEEVALERLSYLTIACADLDIANVVADQFSSNYIRTSANDDVVGAEYAAMLKNIYAIAAGMAHGLGYGDNFQSVLMSNATREMKRFIKKVHKMKRNINETVYLGDLLVTCYSLFSRNRMFGNMIGKGYTVKSAQMEMSMIAEGYYASKSAHQINQGKEKPAQTPIIDTVYDILYMNKDAKKAFKKLTEKLG
ncbi:MAG: glycerol-3-phosphate dehydrogenase [Flavobacteriaceae bacterium]|jgi:glycerol-3-phosphate dehydrogenase (NAD(P)+)|nr:glycerol-3-phosphate dehydrogenase [Flavobacteriaceae bacterium]